MVVRKTIWACFAATAGFAVIFIGIGPSNIYIPISNL
jgi:hypothetical protein